MTATTNGAREIRGFDVPDDPDFEPIDLAARNRGPSVQVNEATRSAIRLRNAISGAVREENSELVLESVARLLVLGAFWRGGPVARALEEE